MAHMAEKFLLSRLSRTGFLILLAITVFAAIQREPVTAVTAIVGAGLVFTSNAFHPGRFRQPWPAIHRLLFVALLLLLFTSLWTGPRSLTHWLYVAPLVGFALLPVAWSAGITVLIAIMAIFASHWSGGIPERHQLISALLLTIMLSGLLVFLREYKSRQLAPLRRTDELTQAASREYLSADLHKEIQRSEREGTDMSVIMIGLDTHLSDSNPDADIRSILPRIGRYLHSQLRDFDTYYRVADLQFLIILPGIATTEAATLAETIRRGLSTLLASHQLDLTVSAGIAGLNIGDNADSLQQSAANALRRAQQQGGNRAQSYSTWSHTSPAARTEETGGPLS
ncbi:GGDEF domain-containing protein [Marinobacter sp. HL-58]|uniref:GGDEF domain-containing protein n=1 Tax=Marinobacter sp. HL-58 TaxID=1479237 RepID=UPI0004854BD7|nr:GGDEF domain-containing protein [Marinobacter sp. HL-58]KPP98229.1 MAG: diguanylate cyclase (GGDEF) domain [Marinobacter sp. HL-58]